MIQNPSPAPVYHNTNGHTGRELTILRASAMKMQERVLRLFEVMKGHKMTAWQVQIFLGTDAPITSIRRCCTNLAQDGKLKAVGKVESGPYRATCTQYTVAA